MKMAIMIPQLVGAFPAFIQEGTDDLCLPFLTLAGTFVNIRSDSDLIDYLLKFLDNDILELLVVPADKYS